MQPPSAFAQGDTTLSYEGSDACVGLHTGTDLRTRLVKRLVHGGVISNSKGALRTSDTNRARVCTW